MVYRLILFTFLGNLLGNYLWAVVFTHDYAKAFDRSWFTGWGLGIFCALAYFLKT
jgi:hypothetical protein